MEKKRKYFKIILLISFLINVYLIYSELKRHERMKEANESLKYLGVNENSEFKKEFKTFFKSEFGIEKVNYIVISTWANFCAPCLKEMPWIDSLSTTVKNINIQVAFLSDISKPDSKNKLANRKWNNSKFYDLSNEQMSSIHNLIGLKTKSYPINLIIDSSLKVFYLNDNSVLNDSNFISTIKALNENKKATK
jgi:thiol-disulfide isomerase/thioredoxin